MRQISDNLQIDVSKILGQGGFAKVYHGTYFPQGQPPIPVAVKELFSMNNNNQPNSYFSSEILLSSKLKEANSPYIVKIYDVISIQDKNQIVKTAYIVMELCNSDLLKYMKGKQISQKQAIFIILQVARGVEVLHKNKCVHRDIKTENVYILKGIAGITEDQFKLGDFGIGKSEMQEMETQIGTLTYMAPEMLSFNREEYTSKVDIWALGILFHELLTGTLLFNSRFQNELRNDIISFNSYLLKWREINDSIQLSNNSIINGFRKVKEEIAEVLDLMIQKDPSKRLDIYQTIEQIEKIEQNEKEQQLIQQQRQQQQIFGFTQPSQQSKSSPLPLVSHFNYNSEEITKQKQQLEDSEQKNKLELLKLSQIEKDVQEKREINKNNYQNSQYLLKDQQDSKRKQLKQEFLQKVLKQKQSTELNDYDKLMFYLVISPNKEID